MINIITIAKDGHNPELIAKLLPVWERSVRATHTFLSNEEILQIKNYVPMAFSGIEQRSLSALSLTSKVSLIHCCTCAVRSKPHSCSTM